MISTVGGIKGGGGKTTVATKAHGMFCSSMRTTRTARRTSRPRVPRLSCFAVINRADHAGQDDRGAEMAISEMQQLTPLCVRLRTRKAFANATAQGLAVAELRPVDTKAVQEFNALFSAVTGLDPPHLF